MKTDLNKLHKVIMEKPKERRSGRTFAKIHELASLIELNKYKTIVCFMSSYQDIRYLEPMIKSVLLDREITELKKRKKYYWEINNIKVFFMTEEEYTEKNRGLENHAIVMMRHED